MRSPKSANSRKRADPPRRSDYTREFLKDWKRLTHSGRYDMGRLKAVMLLLIAHDAPLPAEWRDHALTGEWSDHRECHVGGDFLLIYRLDETDQSGTIIFVRVGTHAELFE